jgi:hypothetical protein
VVRGFELLACERGWRCVDATQPPARVAEACRAALVQLASRP